MVICLEQGADLHMAQLMPLPREKCVCVCVCVVLCFNSNALTTRPLRRAGTVYRALKKCARMVMAWCCVVQKSGRSGAGKRQDAEKAKSSTTSGRRSTAASRTKR